MTNPIHRAVLAAARIDCYLPDRSARRWPALRPVAQMNHQFWTALADATTDENLRRWFVAEYLAKSVPWYVWTEIEHRIERITRKG